jgi:hypothetical protein
MYTKGQLIKYTIIIVAILAVVFLGQQAFFREIGKNAISNFSGQIKTYLAKGSTWTASAVLPSISGGVEKGKEAITNGIAQEKEKISENIVDKIKNYFSGIADSVLHPGENNNCQTQTTQTPAAK